MLILMEKINFSYQSHKWTLFMHNVCDYSKPFSLFKLKVRVVENGEKNNLHWNTAND